MPDFLLEIGTEEIPARMLGAAGEELGHRVAKLLLGGRLDPGKMVVSPTFVTPRRLAVVVTGVALSQPDVTEQIVGPSTKVAFKDDKPTPAAEAFAKKAGIDVSRLERISNQKGEYLAATVIKKGRPAGEILAEALPKEIAALSWPKNMYWRIGKPERFVRPVRWIVAMLDGQVIPLEFAGIKASN